MSRLSSEWSVSDSATMPNMSTKECALTDLVTFSGLFPCTDEAHVNNYLVRQHLLQETRQELQGILSKVPCIRMFYTRYCGCHTPPGARRRTLKKRVLPPIAYTNVEPRKSESSETIACVDKVSTLAALNTNARSTIGRAMVCHQSKLLNLSGEELAEMINAARKAYVRPRKTQEIIDMNEAVKNLYNMEMESPFINIHDQWLACVRAQMKKTEQTDEVEVRSDFRKHDSIVMFKPVETKSVETNLAEPESIPEPHINSCFLGKKRVFPAKNNRKFPEIKTISMMP